MLTAVDQTWRFKGSTKLSLPVFPFQLLSTNHTRIISKKNKYDEEFSSREESADANGNIKGYSGQILESKKKIEIFCATGVMEGMK